MANLGCAFLLLLVVSCAPNSPNTNTSKHVLLGGEPPETPQGNMSPGVDTEPEKTCDARALLESLGGQAPTVLKTTSRVTTMKNGMESVARRGAVETLAERSFGVSYLHQPAPDKSTYAMESDFSFKIDGDRLIVEGNALLKRDGKQTAQETISECIADYGEFARVLLPLEGEDQQYLVLTLALVRRN